MLYISNLLLAYHLAYLSTYFTSLYLRLTPPLRLSQARVIKAHNAKIHRIRGTSNISTLPRIRTYQPHPSIIALAKKLAARRKRPAKTPSPETARPSQRQRQQPSSPSPHPLLSSQPIPQATARSPSRSSQRSSSRSPPRSSRSPPRSSRSPPRSSRSPPRSSRSPPRSSRSPPRSSRSPPRSSRSPPRSSRSPPRSSRSPPRSSRSPPRSSRSPPRSSRSPPRSSRSPPRSSRSPPRKIAPSPAKRAAKMLERGFLGRASRALIDPTPIAANTAENRAILLEKHPIGSKDPFSRKTRPRPSQPITEEAILASIATIGKEKAPGLSG
ncbi:hypothetical protein FOC1_g10000743 [Fusarium oxysporum f. sp. cubense race 1]|uniref:Uncharacterized protein n=1 Tax=Fusarium oxysporum f. sp. cubense (strain race 1) TaxID=1229664 RepID=N4UTL9_FUSC1|nr:hypothetical protein FOC1_g10000743 [Fusarium oxysporum f. sp. cubense race 1]